jgi:hypothetical protein
VNEGVSRRTALTLLGGTVLGLGATSGAASAATSVDPAPVEATWTVHHSGSRPDRTDDLVVTADAAYLAGTVGSVDEMYARVLKMGPPGEQEPSVEADNEFFGALPVHERTEGMWARPDGRFDLVARNEDGESTLHRFTSDGKIDNAHVFDDGQTMRAGAVVPREDGSTLVVGSRSDGTAGAIVEGDAELTTLVDHDAGGTCQAGVARDDGGCLAVGASGDAIQALRVAPDATLAGSETIDVTGDVWRGVAHGDGAAFGGRTTGDFKRGLVLALDADGGERWHATLSLDTSVKDVAPLGDGGVLAVGTHVPENRPWIARLSGDGSVVWEGRLPGDHRGQLTGAHVAADGSMTVAGTVVTDGGPEMLLVRLQETDAAATPSPTATPEATATPTSTATPTATETSSPTQTASAQTDEEDDPSPTEASGPGLGPVAGVAGLLGGALAWRRIGEDESE